MPANTIDASFGLDLSPLKAGWAQAKAVSKAGAAEVASVMKQGLAKAEQASRSVPINWGNVMSQGAPHLQARGFRTAKDFRPAPRGKYTMEDEAGAAGRGGLPAGLRGIGVLAGVHMLIAAYKSAVEQAVKLRDTNQAIFQQTGGGTAVDISALGKKLADISEVNAEIHKRGVLESGKSGGGVGETLGPIVKFGRQMTNWSLGGGNFAEQDAEEAADKERRLKAGASAVEQMAAKQRELNKIEREGFSGDETKAQLMKAELNNRERLLKIAEQESKAGLQGHSTNADAENQRYKQEVESIERSSDLKQKEAELEQRIINLSRSGLTVDEQRLAALKLRTAEMLRQALAAQTTQGRRDADIAFTRAENEQVREEFNQRNAPGPALYTPERAEAAAFKNFTKNRSQLGERNRTLDMSGNEIANPAYARSPYAYDVAPQKGTMPTGGGEGGPGPKEGGSGADVVKAVGNLELTVKRIWGE